MGARRLPYATQSMAGRGGCFAKHVAGEKPTHGMKQPKESERASPRLAAVRTAERAPESAPAAARRRIV